MQKAKLEKIPHFFLFCYTETIMKQATIALLTLVLLGAGCSKERSDQEIADILVDPPQSRSFEELEEADQNLELDRFLTPGSDPISPDVAGGCLGIEPYDRRKYIGAAILVWKLNDGRCYPHMQFTRNVNPDLCDEVHYHLNVMSVDGFVRRDSQPCGSLKASDVLESAVNVWVSPWQYEEISQRFEAFRNE